MKFKNVLIFAIVIFLLLGCRGKAGFKKERKQMVREQLKSRDIKDSRVIQAMKEVKRHKFVPPSLRSLAYTDHALPIQKGQTISQPYIVALMTQSADVEAGEKVLEVGTGSGYQAAVLSKLTKEVYTIEIRKILAKNARARLNKLGYKNVNVKCGNGYNGWRKFAPYDAIIVTCAPEKIPSALIKQLANRGRLVIPVGDNCQNLKLLIKKEDRIEERIIIPVKFVPMIGKEVKGNKK